MDKIKKILKNIGLTETEMDIYLSGLMYSSVGVSELEKQTRIKRTTIYHALNTLMQKGLAAKKESSGKLAFTMTKPENIQRLIEKEIKMLQSQQKELDEIIPLLSQRMAEKEGKMSVSHYEGEGGVKLVIEEALYCKSRHWDIIAPAKNYFSEFNKEYAKYFLETRRQRNLTARSLWEYDFSRRILTREEIKQRNPRYLPEIMHSKFKSVIIIFDDKVVFISSLKELSAIMIQSEEIKNMMSAMFEGLWVNSIDYKQAKKVV